MKTFKEGDLVLRVGLTPWGTKLVHGTGEWTAGRVYELQKSPWNPELVVSDDIGKRFAGPQQNVNDRINEFVSFDELYAEALQEDVDRRLYGDFQPGDVVRYVRRQDCDIGDLKIGQEYDVVSKFSAPAIEYERGHYGMISEPYNESFVLVSRPEETATGSHNTCIGLSAAEHLGGPFMVFDEDGQEKDVYIGTYAEPLSDVVAEPDMVYQPHHYARFTIEPVTFINANKLPYNIGNVIKYSCRYDAKNGVEDLRKAIRYLEMQIETIERDERVSNGEDAKDVWKVAL